MTLSNGGGTTHTDDDRRGRRQTRRLIGVFAVLGLIIVALGIRNLLSVPVVPTERITDKQFINAANGACSRVLPVIRSRRPGRKEVVSVADTIKGSRRDNADLKVLVTELRAIDVQTVDAAKVDRWLDRWDSFTMVGDRYVRALETTDDPTEWQRVANEGNDDFLRISAFAHTNDMATCSLDRAFPRAAEVK